MKRLLWLLIAITVIWGWFLFGSSEPVAPGVTAPEIPLQSSPANPAPFEHGEFSITPLAEFALRARVLGTTRYRFDDGARLSPLDLALGWGRMSDPAVYSRLSISQSGRWYHYSWGPNGPPIPPREIIRNSANMHLVPADDAVEAAMMRANAGDVVALHGQLIRADGDNGWHWSSSMTRNDSGAGSCELIWVQRFEILAR
ncbi:MAG: hypothetical protein R3F22_01350 [Lysobacteraceae bacterium]